jgi:hypothetical protein
VTPAWFGEDSVELPLLLNASAEALIRKNAASMAAASVSPRLMMSPSAAMPGAFLSPVDERRYQFASMPENEKLVIEVSDAAE